MPRPKRKRTCFPFLRHNCYNSNISKISFSHAGMNSFLLLPPCFHLFSAINAKKNSNCFNICLRCLLLIIFFFTVSYHKFFFGGDKALERNCQFIYDRVQLETWLLPSCCKTARECGFLVRDYKQTRRIFRGGSGERVYLGKNSPPG